MLVEGQLAGQHRGRLSPLLEGAPGHFSVPTIKSGRCHTHWLLLKELEFKPTLNERKFLFFLTNPQQTALSSSQTSADTTHLFLVIESPDWRQFLRRSSKLLPKYLGTNRCKDNMSFPGERPAVPSSSDEEQAAETPRPLSPLRARQSDALPGGNTPPVNAGGVPPTIKIRRDGDLMLNVGPEPQIFVVSSSVLAENSPLFESLFLKLAESPDGTLRHSEPSSNLTEHETRLRLPDVFQFPDSLRFPDISFVIADANDNDKPGHRKMWGWMPYENGEALRILLRAAHGDHNFQPRPEKLGVNMLYQLVQAGLKYKMPFILEPWARRGRSEIMAAVASGPLDLGPHGRQVVGDRRLPIIAWELVDEDLYLAALAALRDRSTVGAGGHLLDDNNCRLTGNLASRGKISARPVRLLSSVANSFVSHSSVTSLGSFGGFCEQGQLGKLFLRKPRPGGGRALSLHGFQQPAGLLYPEIRRPQARTAG